MTAPALQRHAGGRPIASATHFPCGDPRTAENTYTRQRASGVRVAVCRACRGRATKSSQTRMGTITRGRLSLACTDARRVAHPPIALRPATLALIESCRVEYEQAVGQLELFTPLPRSDA